MSEIENLKIILQQRQSEVAKLEGKKEAAQEELEKLGRTSFETLEADLNALDTEITTLEQQYDIAEVDFKEEFHNLLEL